MDLNIRLPTMATMTTCQMENRSAPQEHMHGIVQQARLSLMLLAANHFVTRVATSHGCRLAKAVGAKLQTRKESDMLMVYLAEPIAKVRYDLMWRTTRLL